MENRFSFIIPLYNRPQEIQELLESLKNLNFNQPFEVVIIEDGSTIPSEEIIERYNKNLDIQYIVKENTGPGDSRNYGMRRANGNYFIILDSDVILPKNYLLEVDTFLKQKNIDFFGGPDTAHRSFSSVQKAINYSMTSMLTTGGIRGNNISDAQFEPRSFNMGISKEAFLASGGYGNIHPGEDPDLSIRLKKMGFKSAFVPNAAVFHKRRIDFSQFFKQVSKFGKVRPILLQRYPESFKMSYFFPSFFVMALMMCFLFLIIGLNFPILLFILYFFLLVVDASMKTKSVIIGFLSVPAVIIQFFGYGVGFAESYLKIIILKMKPEKTFPNLFFKHVR